MRDRSAAELIAEAGQLQERARGLRALERATADETQRTQVQQRAQAMEARARLLETLATQQADQRRDDYRARQVAEIRQRHEAEMAERAEREQRSRGIER